ncbi:hypothetical protein RFI_17072, partial [Reticulomyxa filosa]
MEHLHNQIFLKPNLSVGENDILSDPAKFPQFILDTSSNPYESKNIRTFTPSNKNALAPSNEKSLQTNSIESNVKKSEETKDAVIGGNANVEISEYRTRPLIIMPPILNAHGMSKDENEKRRSKLRLKEEEEGKEDEDEEDDDDEEEEEEEMKSKHKKARIRSKEELAAINVKV